MYSIDGKKALIIGAGSGIGQAMAVEFARRGACLVVADLKAETAEETAAMVKETGGEALALACDVSSDTSVSETISKAEAHLGGIDILLNTAGILLNGNPEDIPLEEWQRIFNVNMFGAVRLIEHIMPKMIERGSGYIITTASVAGLYPFATSRIPYAASKAALISMTENLAIYLRPKGIRASCLTPGPTFTKISDNMKTWSDDVIVRGPGSQMRLMMADEAAKIFCDGIEKEQVIIASHREETLELMQQFTASPENFVFEKIGRFACGENGLPDISKFNLDAKR